MPGPFSPSPRVSDPDMPWYMPGSLTSGFLCSRWRWKRSRHSRRMHNPQFFVSGKRPMATPYVAFPSCMSVRNTKCSEQWCHKSHHFEDSISSYMYILLQGNEYALFKFSTQFFLECPVDDETPYAQVAALQRAGDKPLPEWKITQFTCELCLVSKKATKDHFVCALLKCICILLPI